MKLIPGLRLYQVAYWGSHRKMESVVIKRVDRATIKAAWYSNFRIRIDEIDNSRGHDPWFTSRAKAIRNTISISKAAFREKRLFSTNERKRRVMDKELRSLDRWLKMVLAAKPLPKKEVSHVNGKRA